MGTAPIAGGTNWTEAFADPHDASANLVEGQNGYARTNPASLLPSGGSDYTVDTSSGQVVNATPSSNPAVTAGCTEKVTTSYNPSGSTTVTEEGSCTVSVSAEGLTIIGNGITQAVTDAANAFVAAVSAVGNAAETFASHFASWLGTTVGGGGYDGDNGDGSGDGGGPGIGDRVLSPSSVTAWSPRASSAVGSSLSHASPMHFDSIVHTMFVA